MAGVKLQNLTKRFRDVVAVDDLNLAIKDKEFLVLVGPSGCGKTTALRMIAGLEEITDGDIYIGDRLVNDLIPKDRDIAMVFQNYALYPHMTVYDNMAFGLKMRRIPKDKIKSEVDRAAKILGLGKLLHRKPKQLSGGQRQRVALGRAIVRRPQVFLMDEPLSNLDAKLRVQTRAELIKLHRELGITTIYVTHDQVEAMTMGHRIAVLNEGVMQQCDTPLMLYRHPANVFVAGFIGSPAMNFVEGSVSMSNGTAVVDVPGMKLGFGPERSDALRPYDGKKITFGVRPEDIHDKALSIVEPREGNTATISVDVMEPMGDRSVIYAHTGDETIIASISSETQARELSDLDVVVDMDKTHAFDPATGDAIFPPPDEAEGAEEAEEPAEASA
ncbi:MAG: sn-glycerol-3-phosphate ABC transporter ATP-binding protein UgpC [Armatimonadia bacterium]|nr:sn-glycerol-3-phosphate ABC transporter ATP-binding protein UgpC [Armatimonadia bacterium]